MYADVKIGDKVVPMVASAATKIHYKQLFKKDLIMLMNRARSGNDEDIQEGATDLVPELAYVMAVQAEKSGFADKNFNTFVEWLENFEPWEIEMAAAQIMALYTVQQKSTSKPKNA